ncbi:hypothetical protein M9H77_33410 [Catharanthus roseus]|uniref:Uncharacterized protein n=1 Tax=Catharanthus roseus TaxID=4058 RepID=A0ACB9ZIN2_CATRO|nr:hypothetical protein M9H77_33410 [Catharanthus roseus]
MSHCVPSWEIVDDDNDNPRFTLLPNSNPIPTTDFPTLDYEVTELTWENGQLALHGLGHPRMPNRAAANRSNFFNRYNSAGGSGGGTAGTLESIVNQATNAQPHDKSPCEGASGVDDELVPWFHENRAQVTGSNPAVAPVRSVPSTALSMDALVSCGRNRGKNHQVQGSNTCGGGSVVGGNSTRVGSCSGAGGERAREARIPHELSSRAPDQSVSGQGSRQATRETHEKEFGTAGFTSTSLGSPGNTSSTKQCHSRNQRETQEDEDKKKGSGKLSVTTKRSRAAAIHNQSERKRRHKINQRMKALQRLVPNSSKTDKASMLDEVIEYLKQLQRQVQLMQRLNMSPVMASFIQQQIQMSMMASMGLGGVNVGIGFVDVNAMAAAHVAAAGRPNIAGMPSHVMQVPFIPAAAVTPWDGTVASGACFPVHSSTPSMPEPMPAYFAYPPQFIPAPLQSMPVPVDFTRMTGLYPQPFQEPSSSGLASAKDKPT